jgi:hypothetical protein
MPEQLSLDTVLEKQRKQRDHWDGFTFFHYGVPYGLRVIGYDRHVHEPGKIYPVVHGRVDPADVEKED